MVSKKNILSSNKDTAVHRHALQLEELLPHMVHMWPGFFEKQPSEISCLPEICLMALFHNDWHQTAKASPSFSSQKHFSQGTTGKRTMSITINIQHDLIGPCEMYGATKFSFLMNSF